MVYLVRLDADCVTLSLGEIEAILGISLPPLSRSRNFWITKANTWSRAGWRYVPPPPSRHRLSMPPLTSVTFVRLDGQ